MKIAIRICLASLLVASSLAFAAGWPTMPAWWNALTASTLVGPAIAVDRIITPIGGQTIRVICWAGPNGSRIGIYANADLSIGAASGADIHVASSSFCKQVAAIPVITLQ